MFYEINPKLKNKRFCHERALLQKGSALAHTNCSNDVTYFMCSDMSKMEMKSLSEHFPLGKKSQQIY